MSHVSSQEGLLSWGRTLVQRNRTGNPSTGPGWRGNGQQSTVSSSSSVVAAAAAPPPGTPPSSSSLVGTPISGRFADTAVEAEEPHWKRTGSSTPGGKIVPPRSAPGSNAGGSSYSNAPPSPTPGVGSGGRPRGVTLPPRQPNRVKSPTGGAGRMGGQTPPRRKPERPGSTDGRLSPTAQSSSNTPPHAGTDIVIQAPDASITRPTATAISVVESQKVKLAESIRAEQVKADNLHQMMTRNEAAFGERQVELNDVLTQVNLQQQVALRHPSMDSSNRGSPQHGAGGTQPGGPGPRVMTPAALTATDRKIRSLEEELWNAELALEKADREEAVCGAAIVRFADCIKQSEDRARHLPDDLHSAIKIARDVHDLSLELRNVCLRTAGLYHTQQNSGLSGAGGYTPRKSILPQGKTKLAILASLPSDNDLTSLANGDAYTECTSEALQHFSQSLCLLLDEVNLLRADRLTGLQEALQVAETQVDRQSLVIDDAHETLTDLQQVAARREEEILEAEFVLKTLGDSRDTSSKKRSELQLSINDLELEMRSIKATHEGHLDELRVFQAETIASTKEKDRAQEDSEAATKQVADNEAKVRTMKNAADVAETSRSKLKREHRSLINAEEDLQREVKGLREKARMLSDDTSKVDLQRTAIQGELDTFDIESRQVHRASDELASTIEELQRQGLRVDRELTAQKEDVAALSKSLGELKDTVEDTKALIVKHSKLEKDHAEDLELVNLVLTQHQEEESAHIPTASVSALSGTNMSVTSAAEFAAAQQQQQHEESRAALMVSPEVIQRPVPGRSSGSAPPEGTVVPYMEHTLADQNSNRELRTFEAAPHARLRPTRSDLTQISTATTNSTVTGGNIVQVQPAPSHYPPTVELLPHRAQSHSQSPPLQGRDPSKGRSKRWGGPSTEREVSEGGTSMSSALSTFYRQQQQPSASPERQPLPGIHSRPGSVIPSYSHHPYYQQQQGTHSGQPNGGGQRALIESDAPVTTRPISPSRAPLLVAMQPRHWNKAHEIEQHHSRGASPPGEILQPQQHTGPLSVQEMRARIDRYARGSGE